MKTRLHRLVGHRLAILLPALLLAAALAVPSAAEDGTHPVLAYYDFEESVPSGPDTFWLRDKYGNRVDLSATFRANGERSLHFREAAGNRDFGEFLAYFEERRQGAVFVQFYVLFTDLDEKFNFGLAGPGWFLNLEPGGQAVWLETFDGKFWHRPANVWREVFTPQPFAWYFVDLVYDVERGTYDLAIFDEACGGHCKKPLVDLRGQRNTADDDNSPVSYASFIGDLEDEGHFEFFVDDFLIAVDPEARLKPFVAPGRRSFFVESMAIDNRRMADGEREELLASALGWLSERRLPDEEKARRQLANRLELAAGQAFLGGDYELARQLYDGLMVDERRGVRLMLKLADVHHQLGDFETERQLRESIYGRLELEELK